MNKKILVLSLIGFIMFSCSKSRNNDSNKTENKNTEANETIELQIESDSVHFYFAVDEKPEIIEYSTPDYPASVRKEKIEGIVVVTVTIDKQGNVINAKIFKSIPELDPYALEAAKEFKFKPARQRGKLVKVKMNVPFDFKLK